MSAKKKESLMKQVEQININIEKIESRELDLDDSLMLYSQSVEISKNILAKLKNIKKDFEVINSEVDEVLNDNN